MNQSQFLAITCNSLEAREKSRVYGAIGFGFDSQSFKPITKRSNRNQLVTFDSHLKTALNLEGLLLGLLSQRACFLMLFFLGILGKDSKTWASLCTVMMPRLWFRFFFLCPPKLRKCRQMYILSKFVVSKSIFVL